MFGDPTFLSGGRREGKREGEGGEVGRKGLKREITREEWAEDRVIQGRAEL